jgi:two-component system sensor histidine kinase MprB
VVEVVVDSGGVRVRDHGTGIDEADLPYVFDRFYRGANSRNRQGSGLGLAIVRQVAGQHGGSIDAANAPDGGAIFTLHLPTVAAESPERDGTRPPWPTTRSDPPTTRSDPPTTRLDPPTTRSLPIRTENFRSG